MSEWMMLAIAAVAIIGIGRILTRRSDVGSNALRIDH
jgi:hypothetical protein